jgi:hypothetical protein
MTIRVVGRTMALAAAAWLIAAIDLASALEPSVSRLDVAQPAQKKRQARTPTIKPEGTGDFTYALKDVVRARSAEFCQRYGATGDCIEEIEICMTMLDRDEDTVRVCMTTAPNGDDTKPRTSGLRR